MTEQEHIHHPMRVATEVEYRGTAMGTESGKLYWHWKWYVCSCGYGPMNKTVVRTEVV